MKSMTFRIFRNTFIIGTLVYFLCALFLVDNLTSYYEERMFAELESEADLVRQGIKTAGDAFLDGLVSSTRITVINPEGNVKFDSEADASTAENHSDRQEIVLAKKNGSGRSVRYSTTMFEKTLYFALMMDNGDILRVSGKYHTFQALLIGLIQPILFMFVIALIVTGAAASILSKQITKPINEIDLDNPRASENYAELQPLLDRIEEENFERKERESLRQEFSANVSHELKTPLTSISGFAELMKDGHVDSDTMRDFAGDIYKETQRLIVLVNDIIKLSKLDEKSVPFQFEKINLREYAERACATVKSAAEKKNVSLAVSGGNLFIKGVPQLIDEMIFNLLDNAVKYNRNGGSVTVTLREIRSAGQKNAVLTVSDTGIGIPEAEQNRVFERFYRVDKSHSREIGGTGLGLSIVKHAAEYHDAKITLKSTVKEGTSVSVTFPENS